MDELDALQAKNEATLFEATPGVPTSDGSTPSQLDADRARMDALLADPKNEFNKGIKKTGQALQSALALQLGYTVDKTTGDVAVVSARSGTIPQLQKLAIDRYNAMTPAQRAAADLKRKQDGFYSAQASREVKETLALLMLESAKALKMEIEDLVKFSTTQPGKISMTALGVGMINLLRPSTSQIGFNIPLATPAKTELVNRNIIA
jgi:hypothetical protein